VTDLRFLRCSINDRRRNQELIQRIKQYLKSDEEFTWFRTISGQYRTGQIPADEYYDLFVYVSLSFSYIPCLIDSLTN